MGLQASEAPPLPLAREPAGPPHQPGRPGREARLWPVERAASFLEGESKAKRLAGQWRGSLHSVSLPHSEDTARHRDAPGPAPWFFVWDSLSMVTVLRKPGPQGQGCPRLPCAVPELTLQTRTTQLPK